MLLFYNYIISSHIFLLLNRWLNSSVTISLLQRSIYVTNLACSYWQNYHFSKYSKASRSLLQTLASSQEISTLDCSIIEIANWTKEIPFARIEYLPTPCLLGFLYLYLISSPSSRVCSIGLIGSSFLTLSLLVSCRPQM